MNTIKKNKRPLNIRAKAAMVLTAILQKGLTLNQALPKKKASLQHTSDQALLQALCFGVIRFLPRLQFQISLLLSKPLRSKETLVASLIYLGLYQLLEMNIPSHAAIFETVEAAKQLNKGWATGLINGILRNFLKNKSLLDEKIKKNNIAFYSHPEWLIQEIQSAWPMHWQSILEANLQHPPLSIRLNIKKIPRNAYIDSLNSLNISADLIPHTQTGITIMPPSTPLSDLPLFSEGFVSVQDGAAQLCAPFLMPKKGDRILDACAAPGGKTAHLLESIEDIKELVAIDIDPERLDKLKDTLSRTQLSATLLLTDAKKTKAWWDGQLFDRILLDAPCSGTGVIRRHPDIKLLRQQSELSTLACHQLDLLLALWPLLKPNGILLYVTCSILPQENERVVSSFLKTQKDAIQLPLNIPYGHNLEIGSQLLPGEYNMDGFYFARLQKCYY